MSELQNTGSEEGHITCAITGKVVPVEESVTIRGYTVCAEGKEVLLERMRSGEAMPGELQRPGVLRRLGCLIADWIVIWLMMMMVVMVFAFGLFAVAANGFARRMEHPDPFSLIMGMMLFMMCVSIFMIGYFSIQHAISGQTLGKKIGGIRVVMLDGSPVTTRAAWLRGLAFLGPREACTLLVLLLVVMKSWLAPFAGVFSVLAGVYDLVNLVFALFDSEQQRALHDRIAGTRVVVVE